MAGRESNRDPVSGSCGLQYRSTICHSWRTLEGLLHEVQPGGSAADTRTKEAPFGFGCLGSACHLDRQAKTEVPGNRYGETEQLRRRPLRSYRPLGMSNFCLPDFLRPPGMCSFSPPSPKTFGEPEVQHGMRVALAQRTSSSQGPG